MGVSILFCVFTQSPFPTGVQSLLRRFCAHINKWSGQKIMATKQQCLHTDHENKITKKRNHQRRNENA